MPRQGVPHPPAAGTFRRLQTSLHRDASTGSSSVVGTSIATVCSRASSFSGMAGPLKVFMMLAGDGWNTVRSCDMGVLDLPDRLPCGPAPQPHAQAALTHLLRWKTGVGS